MPDFLDASVWIPLSTPDHVHYARAREYWDREASEDLLFCRATVMALLRYLTNPKILGSASLGSAAAWGVFQLWLGVPGVTLVAEPAGVDEWLRRYAEEIKPQSGEWSDAYLAAFAAAGQLRLVSFDIDFRKYGGIEFLHL